MIRFRHLTDVFQKDADVHNMPIGTTPNQFLKNIDLDPNLTPTICLIRNGSGNIFYLGRDEWDDEVNPDFDCDFVSYPAAPAAIAVVAIVLAVASVAYTLYAMSKIPDLSKGQTELQQSNHFLSGQQNSVKLNKPVPINYGRNVLWPDVVGQYYTEIVSEKARLHAIFCLGVGDHTIAKTTIGLTDANEFDGIDIDESAPNSGMPLNYPRYVTVSREVKNFELNDDLLAQQVEVIATIPTFDTFNTYILLNFPQGLYYYDGITIQNQSVTIEVNYERLDDNDVPVGGYNTKTVIITNNTRLAFFYQIELNSGDTGYLYGWRYHVWIRRTTPEDSSDFTRSTKCIWIGMYQTDQEDLTVLLNTTDSHLMGFRVQASEQLNDSNSNIVAVDCTRKLPIWDGFTWSAPTATNSPSWAFYDLATNTEYGLGLPASRIDLQHLLDLETARLARISAFPNPAWIAPEDANLRFDTSIAGNEALSQIAQALRCQVYQKSGMLWMARDEYKTAISAFYTADNISEISTEWTPISEFSSNYFEAKYFNIITRKEETVNCVLAGDTPLVKEEVSFPCCRNKLQAWQLGMFYAAQNRYRRKIIRITTDIEGYLPTILDKISITHESLATKKYGYVQKIDGYTVYLDEPVYFEQANTAQIGFKNPDGTFSGPYVCRRGASPFSVIIEPFTTNTPDFSANTIITQEDGDVREPSQFTFGLDESSVLCLVRSVKPSGPNRVSIECVVDDPRVYSAHLPVQHLPNDDEIYDSTAVAFIFKDTYTELEFSPKQATIYWEGSGYDSYDIELLYNENGTEMVDSVNVPAGAPGPMSYVHAIAKETVPLQVKVTPILKAQAYDAFAVLQSKYYTLDEMAKISPIYYA